ncbi:MAG: zinc ribbon domain-containing protein [Candidatus Aminicenantaceae bacterium]
MENKFKEVEESFEQLKKKFRLGVISRREFIDKMKELRLKDDEGRFWMIGAQSGKWYYFEGKNWIRSDPPSIEEKKVDCSHCGFGNSVDAKVCSSCGKSLIEEEKHVCPKCGYELDDPSQECPKCSQEFEEIIQEEMTEKKREEQYIFHSVKPFSFFIFWGIIGFFIGVVLGAFAGASEYFSDVVSKMPGFFQEFQGKLFGGILFAGLGGVAGFIVFGVLGFFEALFVNIISFLVGGIRIKLSKL